MLCVDKPDLGFLSLYKWKECGKQKKLEIIKNISAQWQTLGFRVGLTLEECDEIESQDNKIHSKCCVRVFSKWIERNGCRDYPLSWQGLYDLLCDIDKDAVAEKLKRALASLGKTVE